MSVSISGRVFNLLIETIRFRSILTYLGRHPSRKKSANKVPWFVARGLACETRELDGYVLQTINCHAKTKKHVVYFHGGGYVMQATALHWIFLRKLAKLSDAKVTFVEYPLTPENKHTKTVDHALKVTQFLTEHFDDEFVVGGDSAGGALSLVTIQKLIERDLQQPYKKVLLISPWVNPLSLQTVSKAIRKNDPVLSRSFLQSAIDQYAGEDALEHPHLTPVNGSFEGFPPVGIWMGTRDMFYTDMPSFIQDLDQCAVQHRYYVGEGMVHDYPIIAPVRESFEALRQMRRFIQA